MQTARCLAQTQQSELIRLKNEGRGHTKRQQGDLVIYISIHKLLYVWRFTANQFVLVTKSLRLTTSSFIFQLNICGYSPYVISSPTRGSVCLLQLLLVLVRALIHRSESSGTRIHILRSQIRDSPKPGEPGPRICVSQEHSGPVTPCRHWIPFSLPPTTRRATMEVFDPASTWVFWEEVTTYLSLIGHEPCRKQHMG
jgi:hypothetical protein